MGLLNTEIGYGPLSGFFTAFVCIPTCALMARRLHDIGKSGWLQLLVLIPLLGQIPILIFMLRDSSPGSNDYGPNPKAPSRQYVGIPMPKTI